MLITTVAQKCDSNFNFTHGNCNLYAANSIFFTATLTEFGVWHALQQKGIREPRSKVEEIVSELDAGGFEARKAHRLRRREYTCPGPNKVCHADGYLTIIPRARMGSESIAHEAEGRMGY